MKCTGNFWSWHNKAIGQRRIMGRLDRILWNDIWMATIPPSSYKYLSKSTSDHSPMLLHLHQQVPAGPKPFRFFSYWMNCPSFTDVVSQGWNITIHGSPIFRVVQKLKGTKLALKTWASSSFHSPSAQVSHIKRQLETMQKVISTDIQNTELQKQEVQLQANLTHRLDLEEDQLMQKSREKWLKVGDRIFSFFYSFVKTRIARNNIHQIHQLIDENGKKLTDITDIKRATPIYYQSLFSHSDYLSQFPKITY